MKWHIKVPKANSRWYVEYVQLVKTDVEFHCSRTLTMAPPLTWNHQLSIHRTQHQPLTFPSVHLASLSNVHGRSFLTHTVVINIRSWYPCLLCLETWTGVVIPVIGCSLSWLGAICRVVHGQDHRWYQDPLTSFVGHVIDAAKDSIPRATTVPKKAKPWFDNECREMLKTRRSLDRKVHRAGGPRVETLMSFRPTQAQARRLFTLKKENHGPGMCHNSTPTPQSNMCGTECGKYPEKMSAHPSNI